MEALRYILIAITIFILIAGGLAAMATAFMFMGPPEDANDIDIDGDVKRK